MTYIWERVDSLVPDPVLELAEPSPAAFGPNVTLIGHWGSSDPDTVSTGPLPRVALAPQYEDPGRTGRSGQRGPHETNVRLLEDWPSQTGSIDWQLELFEWAPIPRIVIGGFQKAAVTAPDGDRHVMPGSRASEESMQVNPTGLFHEQRGFKRMFGPRVTRVLGMLGISLS